MAATSTVEAGVAGAGAVAGVLAWAEVDPKIAPMILLKMLTSSLHCRLRVKKQMLCRSALSPCHQRTQYDAVQYCVARCRHL
jgi:hypothetical protein